MSSIGRVYESVAVPSLFLSLLLWIGSPLWVLMVMALFVALAVASAVVSGFPRCVPSGGAR